MGGRPRSCVTRRFCRAGADGFPEGFFQPDFVKRQPGRVTDLQVDAAGRLFVTGHFTEINGQLRPGYARFLADGRLDLSFVPCC